MTTVTERLALACPPGQPSSNAERLLRNMDKVFSHDLPNEMVALQSLLQLLRLEETSRLSEDGHEYVRRLQNTARRASAMVRFLKEMARLPAFPCISEPIALSGLARELQGELQRLHPGQDFTFAWQWHAPSITGNLRVFLQAILELFASIRMTPGRNCLVQGSSQERGDAIVLTFQLGAEPVAKNATVAPSSPALAERMEVVLAREWLALGGARLEVTLLTDAEIIFSMVAPNR